LLGPKLHCNGADEESEAAEVRCKAEEIGQFIFEYLQCTIIG